MRTKILTVDDSQTVRLTIQRALRAYDCAFCEAANGEEGLATLAREKPDLVLLDIAMPVMDGISMLTMLRRHPEFKRTPVIMLSAETSRDTVACVSQLGVSD